MPLIGSRSPSVRLLEAAFACALLTAAWADSAVAQAAYQPSAAGARVVRRVGGQVTLGWPRAGSAPRSALARWLARQAGPMRPRPCRHRLGTRTVACRRAAGGRMASIRESGSAGQGPGVSATIAGAGGRAGPLLLVRSFQIPTDDPAYLGLLNWSWTYDSAVAATAFAATGERALAEQLLDQLSALQHTDGSVEIAFNAADGQAAPEVRAGTVAWVGLAGSVFDQSFGSTRYLRTQELVAGYLLTLQGTDGLIRGGPDVGWYSTEHNLLAYGLLTRLGNELLATGDGTGADRYRTAAARIAAGIDANLLVHSPSGTYFIQGLRDPVQALDAQTLGMLYLRSRGETSLALAVLAHTTAAFAVSVRAVGLSPVAGAYNMTYTAPGPFAGYMPYAGPGAPAVLWTEGTAGVRLAAATLGQPTGAIDQSLNQFARITAGSGAAPLQVDRAVTSAAYGVEYHVWPAAASAAWLMLAQQDPAPALFP
jgi:hypothetical protein